MTVRVDQAHVKLADLLERVRQGDEVIITRDGKSVARLVPALGSAENIGSLPEDPWASCRESLEAAGLKVPQPGSWNHTAFEPLVFDDDGPSASEMLVRDRR